MKPTFDSQSVHKLFSVLLLVSLMFSGFTAESVSIVQAEEKEPETPTAGTPCFTLDLVVASGDGRLIATTPQNCDGGYLLETTVELIAEPASNYELVLWEGADSSFIDETNHVTMSDDQEVRVMFEEISNATTLAIQPRNIGPIGTSFDTATSLGMTGSSYNPGQGIYGDGFYTDHYYVFYVGSTGSRTFRIVENNYIQQYLELFNSNRSLLASGTEEYFLGIPLDREYLTYNFTSTGVYFLRVNDGNSYLDYDLTWDYDGSSSSKALNAVWFDETSPLEGYNDNRTDDWYYVSYSPGISVQISLDGDSGSDFDLYVYDQSNLSSPIGSSINVAYPDLADFTLQSSKTYIKVRRASGAGGYRLEVLPCYSLSTSVSPGGAGFVSKSPLPNCVNLGKYTLGTSVTLTASANTGYVFSSWSGSVTGSINPTQITINGDKSVTANFNTCYTLTTSVNPGGAGSVGTNPSPNCTGGRYTSGTVVTLTATPNSGYSFSSWSGSITGSVSPTQITMNGDKSVTANFSIIQYELITSMNGVGTITSSPTGINCGSDCSQYYNYNTQVTLTASPSFGYGFDHWYGDCSGNGICQVTMTGFKSVGAYFIYTGDQNLTITKNGTGSGTVTSYPAGISCGTICSHLYPLNDYVDLTPTADAGSTFVSWSNGACVQVYGANICTVQMTTSKTITATFNINPTCYTLTTSVNPGGAGSVGANPTPNCTGGKYTSGTVVTLTATPNSGYGFSSWSGATTGSVNPTSITMNGDKSVTANFTVNPTCYILSTSVNPGGGGSIGANPSPNCTGGKYTSGTAVTLTATASSGYAFSSWSGAVSGSSNPTTVTMNSDKSVMANFTANPTCYTLTLARNSSAGGGLPTASPSNSTGCSSGQYTAGQSITVTAYPNSGYSVGSWSGTNNDSSTSASNTVTMPASSHTVTVNYAQVTGGDSFEPDNASNQAKTISSGSPQTHSIIPATDVDWVKFVLTSESSITLETTGPTASDTRMWLYDGALLQKDYSDDEGTGNYSFIDRLCNVDALPSGTYYVKVDEFGNNNEIPSYNLTLTVQSCGNASLSTIRFPSADFNGDGKTDIAVFRPTNGTWYIQGQGSYVHGQAGDIPVPADYDGDGRDDIAVFRPSNSTWYILGQGSFTYGTVGDIPVVADYDGDGKANIAVFRPGNSTWYIYGVGPRVYGTVGDVPVIADYNGDGKDDIAVFRPTNSTWYIYGVGPFVYGTVGDIPVVADYNGDGKADIAVFRPTNSTWYLYGVGPRVYGTVGDMPVIGDYNGDGKADIAVFRPSNSTWYIYGVGPSVFGTMGDIPV